MTPTADSLFQVEAVEPPALYHVAGTLGDAYAFAAGYVAGQGATGSGLRIVRDVDGEPVTVWTYTPVDARFADLVALFRRTFAAAKRPELN